MNKYQECFDYIVSATNGGEGITKQLNVIKELVDKETPKKVQFIDTQRKMYRKKFGKQARYDGVCPSCKKCVYPHYNYCSNCGQSLDYGEENE